MEKAFSDSWSNSSAKLAKIYNANVKLVCRHAPRPHNWLAKISNFKERVEGKLLMIIKPVDFISLARHLFWEMHRKPFICGLDNQPDHHLEDSALQGKGMCAGNCQTWEASACWIHREKSNEHTEVWEPSQGGAWPSSPAFSPPACKERCGQNENVHGTKINQAHVAVCSVHFSNNAEMKSDCKECTQLDCSSVFK